MDLNLYLFSTWPWHIDLKLWIKWKTSTVEKYKRQHFLLWMCWRNVKTQYHRLGFNISNNKPLWLLIHHHWTPQQHHVTCPSSLCVWVFFVKNLMPYFTLHYPTLTYLTLPGHTYNVWTLTLFSNLNLNVKRFNISSQLSWPIMLLVSQCLQSAASLSSGVMERMQGRMTLSLFTQHHGDDDNIQRLLCICLDRYFVFIVLSDSQQEASGV